MTECRAYQIESLKYIYIIGVSHYDAGLEESVYHALKIIKPEVVTVEARSPDYVLKSVENNNFSFLLNNLININEPTSGGELTGAYYYCKDNKIPLYPIDIMGGLSDTIFRIHARVKGFSLDEIIINALKNKKLEDKDNNLKRIIELPLRILEGLASEIRDEVMLSKIMNLKEKHGTPLAHIGGKDHFPLKKMIRL